MVGGFRIGRIFGIPIYLHPTWLIIFGLVFWMLETQLRGIAPHWSAELRLGLAAAAALLFFASILLHELGHSVLAIRHRVPVKSITLFVFGGVALMERDPDDPRAEMEIAIAGPVVSALLALAFSVATRALPEAAPVRFLTGWLGDVNLIVALFNLIPGFPLDGGRVLRAVLWAITGDPVRATRTAAGTGQIVAYGFIALGALEVLGVPTMQALGLGAGPVSGLWFAFIGWMLLALAGGAVRQVELDASLRGLCARDILGPIPAWLEADSSVAHFARELVMRGRRWALVQQAGEVAGLVTLSDVRRLDPDAWETTPVSRVATPVGALVTASLDAPVRDLLVTMGSRDLNQIPIVDAGRIVGAVTRETLVHAIELRRRGHA